MVVEGDENVYKRIVPRIDAVYRSAPLAQTGVLFQYGVVEVLNVR
jgi:hypothetical protein